MRVKQINNMKLHFAQDREKWEVITPDGRVIEEFVLRESAVVFMENTLDFLSSRTKERYEAPPRQ